jgi:Beta-lactamase
VGVDIELYGKAIESILDAMPTLGYSYFIMKQNPQKKGALGPRWLTKGNAKGLAILPGQDPMQPQGLKQSQFQRMETASVSKTITAVAVLKKLAELKLSVDTSIESFLPSEWKPLNTWSKLLTFRRLLEHTSGLPEKGETPLTTAVLPGSLYDSMKQTIAQGPNPTFFSLKQYHYQNVNYSLFRVILPYMVYFTKESTKALDDALAFSRKIAASIGEPVGIDDAPSGFKDFLGSIYVTYVLNNVLVQAGIPDANITTPSPSTKYYNADNPLVLGTDGYPDPLLLCGGVGWKLSSAEVCKFAAMLSQGGFGSGIWSSMVEPPNLKGLTNPSYVGLLGKYFGKSGGLPW